MPGHLNSRAESGAAVLKNIALRYNGRDFNNSATTIRLSRQALPPLAIQYGEAPAQLFNAAAQKLGTLLIL
jgi:hypothetical protein